MWGEPKQASSATTSIIYLTIGGLVDVWSGVAYVYCLQHNASDETMLWVYGAFFSGVVLILIGLAVGRIGRSAMPAEVTTTPPPQLVSPAAQVLSAPAEVLSSPGIVEMTSPVNRTVSVAAAPAVPNAPTQIVQ